MSTTTLFLWTGLILFCGCMAVSAAAKRPSPGWNYYHFDGRAFTPGLPATGGPFVAVREQMQPVILTRPASPEAVPLTGRQGAVAGICYIQTSGGKLTDGTGFQPCGHAAVPIRRADRIVATPQTDGQGFFTAVLEPGSYQVGTPPLAAEITVEPGITRLVPLRAGKRMVD